MPSDTYSPIDIGKMHCRIQIFNRSTEQDPGNAGWADQGEGDAFANCWAAIEPLTGRELFAAQQRVAEVSHKVTIRWRPGILANQGVWYGKRQFDIQVVLDPDERKCFLVLLCKERNDSVAQAGNSPVS
jgi:SPP1 family predicted phage head-tail adaptor